MPGLHDGSQDPHSTDRPHHLCACGPLAYAEGDPNAITNPALLVEVLSPATEAYDRGEKFEHYAHLASFRDYVLVASDRVAIEHRRRDASGAWRLETLGPGGRLTLEAHGVAIEVDAIYDGVELAQRSGRRRPRREDLPERAN